MSTDIETTGVEGVDFNIVEKHGKKIVVPIRKEGEAYSKDPQVRAFQLYQEGRFGGKNRGQGRKRKPRAAEVVAEEVRKMTSDITSALRDGLNDGNIRTRLLAADQALKIEKEETLLQLKEEGADIENMNRDDLIAELFSLGEDPLIEASVKAFVEIPEHDIEEVTDAHEVSAESEAEEAVSEEDVVAAAAASSKGQRSRVGRVASRTQKARDHSRKSGDDGAGRASGSGEGASNPFTARAKRRTAD